VTEGRMQNYLRMLWGKKILQRTKSPRAALRVMIDSLHELGLGAQKITPQKLSRGARSTAVKMFARIGRSCESFAQENDPPSCNCVRFSCRSHGVWR
jgi:hypothetical protein